MRHKKYRYMIDIKGVSQHDADTLSRLACPEFVEGKDGRPGPQVNSISPYLFQREEP
jgi:hypothetical protein